MKKRKRIILSSIIGFSIALNLSYLIYEGVVDNEHSLINKINPEIKEEDKKTKVKGINIKNLDGRYLLNTSYKLDYEVLPLDAYNKEVILTHSSNIEIKDDHFKIIKDSALPLEITLTSKENKNIKDTLIIDTYNPIYNIDYELNSLKKVETPPDINLYEAKVNEVFKLDFNLTNTEDLKSDETLEIEHSSNITRIDDNHYYLNKDPLDDDCYIKANLIGLESKVVEFIPVGIKELKPITNYKIYDGLEEVKPSELIINRTYKLKAFNKDEELYNYPYKIDNDSPLIKINYNEITLLDANPFNLKINYQDDIKEINIKGNHLMSDDYGVRFEGIKVIATEFKLEAKLYTSFYYKLILNNITYKDFRLEVGDKSILELHDGYISTNKEGSTTLKVIPNNEAYKDFIKTYDIEVHGNPVPQLNVVPKIICLIIFMITIGELIGLCYLLSEKLKYVILQTLIGVIYIPSFIIRTIAILNIARNVIALRSVFYIGLFLIQTITIILIAILKNKKEQEEKK